MSDGSDCGELHFRTDAVRSSNSLVLGFHLSSCDSYLGPLLGPTINKQARYGLFRLKLFFRFLFFPIDSLKRYSNTVTTFSSQCTQKAI